MGRILIQWEYTKMTKYNNLLNWIGYIAVGALLGYSIALSL